MKQFFIALCVLTMVACGNKNKAEKAPVKNFSEKEMVTPKVANEKYASFGEKIQADAAISSAEMYKKYQTLEIGDTLNVKFTSQVASVCKKKGCWMQLKLGEGEESRVSFKDYSFFVPKDIENKTVIVQGKAFVTELSVDDLQHYAEDAGKSDAEIAAITEPEKTLSFEAIGVLIEK